MADKNKHLDIDLLLKGVFKTPAKSDFCSLRELYEQRIDSLKITKHQAFKILEIDHKALDALLSGDTKRVDFLNIIKLSQFLEIPYSEIVNKYFQILTNTHNDNLLRSKKRSFIVNNFNLPSLRKIGFINSLNDFDHIENKILTYFGYEDIFQYASYKVTPAFSSAKRNSNAENLAFWIASAYESLKKTSNPFEYDRKALIEYFPTIRWHSMNVENGLYLVAQALFKMGITLIYVPKFTTDLHVRGATFSLNNKPCIVLTKYTNFYPSFWFALIHELYHVLYDLDKIEQAEYHISGEIDTMNVSEEEANNFAREYLFSDAKMSVVKPHINDPHFVKLFAEENHVHPSFIYVFNAFDSSGSDNRYAKFKKYLPDFTPLLEKLNANDWVNFTPIKQISKERNSGIFNLI